MPPPNPVEVIRHDDAIVEIRLVRPEVRNALNEATAMALADALQAAAEDVNVHCVLLCGDV